MKTLIVCYSNSGNTAKLCAELSALLPEADVDTVNYPGGKRLGFLRSLFKIFSAPKIIEGVIHGPSEYERIILICPIWAGLPAPVMRAYLAQNAENLKDKEYSLVFRCGSSETVRAAAAVSNILGGNLAVKVLTATGKQAKTGGYNLREII